ncbi:hypothetical protein M0R04_13135 [Candidatus Dojkabacteria bacterium]|jgi:hypothetical protein|nr:hypothetical protein [Candidatus Dojkabacteria bacterium]
MIKIKLSEKEIQLLKGILNATINTGWESCLGGYDESDKRAINKYEKEMLMVEVIRNKLK